MGCPVISSQQLTHPSADSAERQGTPPFGMVVRKVSKEEIPHLARMLLSLYDNELVPGPDLRPTTEQTVKHLSNMAAQGTLLVGIIDGELVGCIGGLPVASPWSPDKPMLSEYIWYVNPDHRGSGIGRHLVREWGKIPGFTSKTVITTPGSSYARKVLEEEGYREMETVFILTREEDI